MKKTGTRKNPAGGKGVYLAIAVSAVAVGAVAWLATNSLTEEIEPIPPLEPVASLPESGSTSRQVDVSKSDIPRTENFVVSYPSESSMTAELPSQEGDEAKDTGTKPLEPAAESSQAESETHETSSSAPAAPSWASPVAGTVVTNPYSNGELVKSRTLGEWRTHDGIDLAAAEGEPVKAAADGVVKDVRSDSRWGFVVEVEHGDVTAYYCGLADSVKVEPGAELKQGDQLGEVGNTSVVEASEEAHLHLGMKQDGKWIDPAAVLGLA